MLLAGRRFLDAREALVAGISFESTCKALLDLAGHQEDDVTAPKCAAFFFLVVLLAGCSGEQAQEGKTEAPAQQAAQSAPDACSVLTADDIHQALGMVVKVQAGDQLKSMSTLSQCSYEWAENAQNVLSVLVRLGTSDLTPETNLKQYVDGLKTNMGESYQIDPVAGLSGPGVWNPDMKQLTVFKGSTLIILTMSDVGSQDPLEAAKVLAERALPRI